MSPSEKGKALYGGKAEDFDSYHQYNQSEVERTNLSYTSGNFGDVNHTQPNPAYSSAKNSSTIKPEFTAPMQTSLGYARYSSKYSGFKNPNPQSPMPVIKK